MKYFLLSVLLLVGLVAGCKKKEEPMPAPVPLIVGTWQWGARTIATTTGTGQIDPLQPPPVAPYNMTSTYAADGSISTFANGVTHTSGTYVVQGNQLTQTIGYPAGTYTVLDLTDARMSFLISYQNGTAHYEITDYYTRLP